jgi:hypothetical protein
MFRTRGPRGGSSGGRYADGLSHTKSRVPLPSQVLEIADKKDHRLDLIAGQDEGLVQGPNQTLDQGLIGACVADDVETQAQAGVEALG